MNSRNGSMLLATAIFMSILSFGCKKEPKPGKVKITVYFNTEYSCQRTTEIGLGYSSQDTQNESFFDRTSSQSSPFVFSSKDLAPGTYYYKATSSSGVRYSHCTTPSTKSGAITIKENETTEIEVNL